MKHLAAFALIAVCLFPAFAWSCGYNFPLPKVYALDFLILGVAVGAGFRLLMQPLIGVSNEMGAAIFLSSLFASLGVGLAVTHNPGWGFGEFAVSALVLAPFGAMYPKNGFVRFLILAPTCFIACVAVRTLHHSWVASGEVQPHVGLMF